MQNKLTAGAGTSQYISTVKEHEAAQKHAANPASKNDKFISIDGCFRELTWQERCRQNAEEDIHFKGRGFKVETYHLDGTKSPKLQQ